MSGSELDDTAMTSSSSLTSDVNRALRLTGAKTNSRYFGFPWKQRNTDGINSTRNLELKDVGPDSLANSKISNGFLKNIKKRLRLKNLSLCKAKQKIIVIDSQCNGDNVDAPESQHDERSLSFVDERNPIEANERVKIADSDILCDKVDEITENSEADACWASYSPLENRCDDERDAQSKDDPSEIDLRLGIRNTDEDENNSTNVHHENAAETLVVIGGNVAEPQSTSTNEIIETNESVIDAQLSNNSRAKVNLSEELLKLSKYGWYWGPISGDEADSKLISEPDGAFLVRDSSDDRYLLTLSFKSSGRLLHARMEHSGGLFSLCNQGDNEGYTSVAALIDHSMNSSQSAVFCYSRPKYPGYPSFPVRLTKPVSRFTQVRSLQYLCRFVIRQNTRLDNIHKLPLPKTIRGYIEEAHY